MAGKGSKPRPVDTKKFVSNWDEINWRSKQTTPTEAEVEYKCGLDDPKWRQCCCNCRHHIRVDYHCCSEPKPDKSLYPDTTCCCNVQKGWACIIEIDCYRNEREDPRIFDNWPEHSIGCEMYHAKLIKPKEGFDLKPEKIEDTGVYEELYPCEGNTNE